MGREPIFCLPPHVPLNPQNVIDILRKAMHNGRSAYSDEVFVGNAATIAMTEAFPCHK
jgi:hypothetical protein